MRMENNYEDDCVRLNELSEGDEFIGKWSNMVTRYLKNLGEDRHLIEDIETKKQWVVPHGRFPSFKKINPFDSGSSKKSYEKIKTFINQPMQIILEKPDYDSWNYYSKLLPLSEEIYLEMFGETKTHAEWADKFNKIGKITKTIINYVKQKK